jgi:hypothetical protein
MTFKEAALNQSASQEQPVLQNPTANRLEGNISEEIATPTLKNGEPVNVDVRSVISDEVLRYRIRTLIKEEPRASVLKRFLNHPLFIGLIIAALGGLLTYYYSVKQQELASQRSFSDELNKIQIQKIGEVWEQIDKNEILLDDLLDKANKTSNSNNQNNQNVDAINNLIQEDRIVVNKNRFWLGEQNYNRLQDYLDKNVRIALNILLARPGTDFKEIIEDRKHAKQDILQIRESMRSEGQPAK